jgi:hypothetical protein
LNAVGIFISEYTTGAMVYSTKSLTTNTERVEARGQRMVLVWPTKCSIRLVVPRKSHVEHANESPFRYVTDVADRDPGIEIPGVWFPQCEALIQGRELLPVSVERWLYWHDGRKLGGYLLADMRDTRKRLLVVIIIGRRIAVIKNGVLDVTY